MDMGDWMKDIDAKDKDVNKRSKLKGVSLILIINSRMFFFRASLLIIILHSRSPPKFKKQNKACLCLLLEIKWTLRSLKISKTTRYSQRKRYNKLLMLLN